MSLGDDLQADVSKILREEWTVRDGHVVPNDESLRLSNDAIELDATVLYADLADSTQLVDGHRPLFAAEIYKTFLLSAARVIRSEGGEVTAYDGDRIMALYIGDMKNTRAVKTALKINYAAQKIVMPALKAQYPQTSYQLRHVVGIDTSALHVARTGVRGANDLVWVGRAANHAAKLSANPETYQTYISKNVYDQLHESAKFGGPSKENMWTALQWTRFDGRTIYGSTWWWSI
jgi:class 3 adenylate cyclase